MASVSLTPQSTPLTGTVVGYDPGGNGKHGFAWARVENGNIVTVTTKTLHSVEDVVLCVLDIEEPLGLGIDTLTCWGTGRSGWRPADRWLRERYPDVRESIQAPNSLYGAMSVNGMAVLVALRQAFPDIFVTETHPKVLYHSQCNRRYNYKGLDVSSMNQFLSQLLGVKVESQNEHEWDAAISILPVVNGLNGLWTLDLHDQPTDSDERLVLPCDRTVYVWPDTTLRSGRKN